MSERPILFSSPMIRAVLAGTKTQTRRVVSPQPWGDVETFDLSTGFWVKCGRDYAERCPYGQAGATLWIRETWCRYTDGSIGYAADYPKGKTQAHEIRWRPSIHLRRADARIRLRVAAVRAERLQDMSESDAFAEGINHELGHRLGSRVAFVELWDSLNGGRGRGFPWRSNPWVWVISFKRELQ